MARASNPQRGRSSNPSGKKVSLVGTLINLMNRVDVSPVPAGREQWRRTIGWALVLACVLSLIACVSYFYTGVADESATLMDGAAAQIQNTLGLFGYTIGSWLIRSAFGVMSFVGILYVLFIGLVMIEGDYFIYVRKLFRYVAILILFGSIFLAYVSYLGVSDPTRDFWGGAFGNLIINWLIYFLKPIGVALLFAFGLIAFLTLNFNADIRASQGLEKIRVVSALLRGEKLPATAAKKSSNTPASDEDETDAQPADTAQQQTTSSPLDAITNVLKRRRQTTSEGNPSALQPTAPVAPVSSQNLPFEPDAIATSPSAQPPTPPATPPITARPATPSPASKQPTKPTLDEDGEEQSRSITLKNSSMRLREGLLPKGDGQLEFVVETGGEDEAADLKTYEQIGDYNVGVVVGSDRVEKIVESESQELDEDIAAEIEEWEDFDPTLELSDYIYPSWAMLENHGGNETREVDMRELEDNKNRIIKTLLDYKIEIVKITATIGPTVTLYEIVPAPGVRISKIRNLEDDIALSLSALGIRIIAPIPGKGTIGIEVPNSKPEIVSLRSVLQTQKFLQSKLELPIALGKTIDNKVFVADLHKMPHLLIAGATGQGKSVGLNTVIASILFKRHPGEVKFVLIDPKKVEMSLYQSLHHHFLAQMPDQSEPIITDTREAINVLKCLCVEMDMRYDLLKKARVRNIQEYNDKFKKRQLSPRKGHFFMPYIVLVIDELADMMMTAGKEVEMPIARLAQLARAVGIHLVVATQRPSVNVITGIIKANFPARMSYRVISKVDSRTILDANGADQLIGRGDLLLSTGSELIRIQNAFIDTHEVERLVEFIAEQRGYSEPYMLPDAPKDDKNSDDDDEDDDTIFERDPLFKEAARMMVRYQIGSASLIQRKMKLGYNRAGRIIDQMERAGIVGVHSGSKAREVLYKDENELERLLATLD